MPTTRSYASTASSQRSGSPSQAEARENHVSAASAGGTSGLTMPMARDSRVSRSRSPLARSRSGEGGGEGGVGGGVGGFVVGGGAGGRDGRGRARLRHHVETVAERKEGIGGARRALGLEAAGARAHHGEARRVHAIHLSRA